MQPPPRHPSEHIQDLLTSRRVRLKELAARMDGDALTNRALLWHYLFQPNPKQPAVLLGSITARKLDEAFDLKRGHFRALEVAWCESRGLKP